MTARSQAKLFTGFELVALIALLARAATAPPESRAALLAFALALAPRHLERALALAGKVEPRAWALVPEAIALLGLLATPVAPWAIFLALATTLAGAFQESAEPGAESPWPARASTLTSLATGLVLAGDVFGGGDYSQARLLLFVPLAVERAFVRAPRTWRQALGHLSGCAVLLATYLTGRAWIPALAPRAALALVPSLLLLVPLVRARPAPAQTKLGFWAVRLFGLAAFVSALLFFVPPFVEGERTIDLARTARAHVSGNRFESRLGPRAPLLFNRSAAVFEDGERLWLAPDTATVENPGSFYVVSRTELELSSSDHTDPTSNGRSYTVRERPSPIDELAPRLALLIAAALGLAAWRLGALELEAPSVKRLRAAGALAVLLGMLAGFAGSWSRVAVAGDTQSYVGFSPNRMPLYPLFLRALDREPGADLEETTPLVFDPFTRDAPAHRFLFAARAQKALLAIALAAAFWAFSEGVNVWLLLAIVYMGAWADAEVTALADSTLHGNATQLGSEGLNQPLVFFFLGALAACVLRPSWPRALGLATTLALLVLDRPNNLALAAVLGLVWLVDRSELGWKRATARSAVLALVVLAPLFLVALWNQHRFGHARLTSSGGLNLLALALEISTPEDASAFDDETPEVREFARACLLEHAADKADYRIDPQRSNNSQCYRVIEPETARWFSKLPRDPFAADERLTRVANRLLARHRPEYLARGLFLLRTLAVDPVLHGLAALAAAAALALYYRTRDRAFLLFAALQVVPWLVVGPISFVTVPLLRYQCQTGFLADLALPLFGAILLTRGPGSMRSLAREGEPGVSGTRLEAVDPAVHHTFRALEARRRPFVEKLLSRVPDRDRPLRVLDIGCATGEHVFDLAAHLPAARLTGVDVSVGNVATAEAARAPSPAASRIDFQAVDYAAFATSERFDLILSESCLQYVSGSDEALFGKTVSALAPGGLLAISIPRDSLHSRAVSSLRRLMRRVRCRPIDWLAIAAARLFHPTFSEEELRQRAFYVFYLAPLRLDGRKLRELLVGRLGLELVEEDLIPVYSFFQLQHRLSIFRKPA